MKRLRSYDDDLDSIGDRGVLKDWGRRDQEPDRSHRRFYSKAENGRKGLSSSSGYDRSIEDDREVSRSLRKRFDHDSDGFERRKSFDRYRDCGDRGISLSSPRTSYSGDRIHRSESFCGSRREFPKGFRSERDRSRREESVSSWRRFGGSKDVDEDARFNVDTGRGRRVVSEERGNVRSPQGSRDVLKSSPCSKDSGGEQSKSTKVKKNEEVHKESGSSSEMEEGELQPEDEATPAPEGEAKPKHKPKPEHEEPEVEAEPKPESEPNQNAEAPGVCTENCKELESVHAIKSEMDLEKGGESSAEEKIELNGKDNCDGIREDGTREPVTEVVKEIDKVPERLGNSDNELSTSKEATVADNVGREGENAREDCESVGPCVRTPEDHDRYEATKDEDAEKPLPLEEERNEGKGIDLEADVKDIDLLNSNKEVAKANGTPKVTLNLITEKSTQNSKDKGKSLAVSSYNEANSMEDGLWKEEDVVVRREAATGGPSCRGFELFSSLAATRQEKTNNSGVYKQKDGMLKMEPLDLSLGLPNVSLELHSLDPKPAPGSPSRIRSVQSVPSTFWTGSDGFTASISFSGSQPFVHNPSCSLTQNSFDNYEQSVGSHPIFKGVDQISHGSWQVQSSNDPKRKEVPLYPRILQNGNASQSSQGILNHHTAQVQDHNRNSEGTSGVPVALDWQSSRPRQLTGVLSRNQDEIKSHAHGVVSLEVRPEYSEDKKWVMREKRGGSLFRSSSQKEIEQPVVGGTGFVERIIAMIILEPVQVMAKRIHEMTEQSIACLKESVREMIVNEDKHGQLRAFQEALQSRSDLTLETLSKCNRAQLEILVAFKTGLQDFLYRAKDSSPPDLAEIFLNLKCRNLACGSPLPVDECDCKVCAQKSGFCSACMCLVCSKFDMASNTCSWVGCDFCLHWCHTSCGLRESYIRNGHSVTGAQGTTEMQFHCLACNHPSEMFGFVKEVFKTCAREWKDETLSKELEYVKRIFSASNDVRGKQLHNVAEKMQARLENNKSNLSEVYNQIMEFLTETDSKLGNTSASGKEQSHRNPELSSGVFGPSQEAMWLTSVSTEKTTPQLENAGSGVPILDWDRVGRSNEDSQLQKSVEKKPVIDELESIVRIKQAEAKMFQARADDARREAEGLKRIAIAKNEKIEEEYGSRITKLCLAESEERRRQKLEELQILERSHREYFNMKMRMEAEIQDLLLKMETAKINLST
ncbi:protein OBERON 4-like isoform X2 [Telopea speciosissima]|uniref:protein OBERON 4-like isoform X2 n=1 Tax=Telopea speciosissima TaxID=54955 RepID=UPI001CC3C527|nr:protein OBERON 4-like isoform X2 [Telopea speciosissima]